MQQLYKARTTISHDDQNKNVATVLLGDQKSLDEELSGETTEANVMSALEQKYDAIKDKLLIEVDSIAAVINPIAFRAWLFKASLA